MDDMVTTLFGVLTDGLEGVKSDFMLVSVAMISLGFVILGLKKIIDVLTPQHATPEEVEYLQAYYKEEEEEERRNNDF